MAECLLWLLVRIIQRFLKTFQKVLSGFKPQFLRNSFIKAFVFPSFPHPDFAPAHWKCLNKLPYFQTDSSLLEFHLPGKTSNGKEAFVFNMNKS